MRRHLQRHLSGRFGRSRHWRPRVLGVLLILIAILCGGLYYLTRPQRLARMASAMLADITDADVHISTARIGWDGSIHLQGVDLWVPGNHPEADRLFTAQQILINHDLWSLVCGRFRATELVLIEPTLYLTEDADSGRFNFQRLPERTGAPEATFQEGLPGIIVREGTLQHGEVDGGRYADLGSLRADGKLMPRSGSSTTYFFELRQQQTGGPGAILSGVLDTKKHAITAKFDHLAFSGPQRNVLPRRFRTWWDRLKPAGDLPTADFGYDPDLGFHFVLEARDVALTPPTDFIHTRLTHVNGQLIVSGETITLSNVTGKADTVGFAVNGRIDGFDARAPMNLVVRLDPFTVPNDPAYVEQRAPMLARVLEHFPGTGTLKAIVHIERKKLDEPASLDGTITVLDAAGCYAKFAYPLKNIRGELKFNNDLVEVVTVNGQGRHGGRVSITGQIANPGEAAAVHIVVNAVDLPLDEDIRNALNDKQREALDMFLDTAGYQRLIDLGLLQTSKQKEEQQSRLDAMLVQRRRIDGTKTADVKTAALLDQQIAAAKHDLEKPVFDLGGTFNVEAIVERPAGEHQKFNTSVSVESSGFNILFTHWPYPLRLTGGRLEIKPPKVFARAIEAKGLAGGRGHLDGTVDLTDGKINPDMIIAGVGIRVDPVLLASIPQPQDRWLRDLQLTGSVDASGRILRDQTDHIAFQIDAQLNDGKAQPFGGRYAFDKLTGGFTIEPGRVTLTSLYGEHGPTRLNLNGSAQWDGGTPRLDLACSATAIHLDDPILDMLPPQEPRVAQLKSIFEEHKVTGRIDLDLKYATDSDGKSRFDADLRPQTLGFDLRGNRVKLSDIHGGLHANADGLKFDRWSAALDTGRATVSGTVQLGDHPGGELTFDASDKTFGPSAKALLPISAAKVVAGLEVQGAYDIKGAHLVYHPRDHGAGGMSFIGKVHLADASANIGVKIDQLTGDLSITAASTPGTPGTPGTLEAEDPTVDLRLNAERLAVVDRVISPMTLRLASAADNSSMLEIKELDGGIYGGSLLGSGSVDTAHSGRYRISVTVQNAPLDPVIHPERYAQLPPLRFNPRPHPQSQPTTKPDAAPTGVLSASLAIDGEPAAPGSPSHRSGRGNLEIRDANIYEVPLEMGLLQIVNLSLPTARSFDRASASYLLYDDTVKFDSIAFEAPSVQIVGDGKMQYSTRALDLNLTSRNAGAIGLGPVTWLLRGIKDEIASIHVSGTLTDPKVEVRSFNSDMGNWDESLNRPLKKGQPLAPTPPLGDASMTPGQ